jgi:DNA-3-methyladenine glycosylase I
MTPRDVERLVIDASIVRHRGKIESTINNARRAVDLAAELGSLGAFFWQFEPAPHTRPTHLTRATLSALSESAESRALSRALKQRGWSFVGPTTMYAFMQAMGLVNDHLDGCDLRRDVERARRAFRRPKPV